MKNNQSSSHKRIIWLYLVLVIGLGAVAVSSIRLWLEYRDNQQAQSYYAALAAMIPATTPPVTAPVTVNEPTEVESPPPWQPYLDFTALQQTIPDLIAWVRCPESNIDYPVVWTTDNDFYLSHLPDGTSNPNGSIFLDYRNSPDFTNRNSVIYGHHLRNGEMFSSLVQYRDQAYYEAHPVVFLSTATIDYEVELIAGYLIDPVREVPPLGFADNEAFQQYITGSQQRSYFKTNVTVSDSDRLVTLVTCDFAIDDGRFLLIGVIREVGGQSWMQAHNP